MATIIKRPKNRRPQPRRKPLLHKLANVVKRDIKSRLGIRPKKRR